MLNYPFCLTNVSQSLPCVPQSQISNFSHAMNSYSALSLNTNLQSWPSSSITSHSQLANAKSLLRASHDRSLELMMAKTLIDNHLRNLLVTQFTEATKTNNFPALNPEEKGAFQVSHLF